MEDDGRAPSSSAFGMLLRRYRLAAGLTQEALAERARISPNGLGALERGDRRSPQRETLALLTAALALSDEERRAFEAAAARPRLPLAGRASLTAGPRSEAATSNLPLSLTTFVGRDAELAEILTILRDHRLVTITGTGGIGKTRTALQAGRILDTADGGVWLVELAPVANPLLVSAAIASTLGVQEVRNRPLLEPLLMHLRNKKLLLIVDNCEHVIAEASLVADSLLRGCPGLRILATSREPLRVLGERTYRLPSLGAPSLEGARGLDAAEAATYGAVALFAGRAQAADHRFRLSDQNAPVVAEICRRLDGIPLAIELAAARVTTLTVETLAEKLDQRFRILTGGDRTALARQQTMRATIEWSYDLLSPQERQLFARLSVFAGGCTLAAANAVCADAGSTEFDVIDTLSSLVDKSLVVADLEGSQPRYRLFESTRTFALASLAVAERQPLALRHAEWVAEFSRTAEARSATEGETSRFAALLPDLDNIRAALDWCERNADFTLGAQISSTIADVFYWNGLAEEGSRWVRRSLDGLLEEQHPTLAARLYCSLARLTGDANTRFDAAQRAVALSERVGDPSILGSAYMRYAVALYATGKLDEALATSLRASATLQQDGEGRNMRVAWVLQHRSWILVELGRLDEARECLQGALAIFKELKADREAWGLCCDLAELEFAAGRAERALEIVDEAIPNAADINDPARESVFTCNRAGYLLSLGEVARGEATAREALLLAARTQGPERALHALEHLAAALACRGDVATAAQLSGFVQTAYTSSGYERETTERSSYELLSSALHRCLSDDDLAQLVRRGAAMTSEQAIELAIETEVSQEDVGATTVVANCAT